MSLLVGDGGYSWYTVIETRLRNQDTELGWNLQIPDTPETGRHAGPLQGEKQPKTARESDHLIVLRDGRAVHMGKGLTGIRSLQREH